MVRVRIAPSPTGDPHVGTGYIALFNYVFAKKHGGSLVLRMEDTDQSRSHPAWEKKIIEALHWLGLSWDEGPDRGGPYGPYRQSERGDVYRTYADSLVERGAAYLCFCTPERLAQLRRQQRQRNVASGYDGRCRLLTPQEVQAQLAHAAASGGSYVVRLKVPREGSVVIQDRLRGPVSFGVHQIDDQILLKSDGMPTYHLANVVDDHLMKITHVMRAEEWITSTPKHVLLYRGFQWPEPEWIHMPLLRNQDKSKISKRKNPVSLTHYQQAGYYPEAMLNYLAMMGWTMPNGQEKFSVQEMIDNFTWDRMSLGGPVFDVLKLTWLNGLYIRDQSAEHMVQRWRETILTDKALQSVAKCVHDRIEKLEDIIDHISYFFNGDVVYEAAAQKELIPKKRDAAAAMKALEAVLEVIDGMPELHVEDVEKQLRDLSKRLGWQTQELFMAIRVAVTGRKATPPLFETMVLLGKERCRRRLRAALDVIKAS